jgi:Na+/H+ antiporter NhaD/arsenite permease-like protein
MNRGRDLNDAISLGVTAFLIFFLFHVVMEFSGQNQAMIDETKLTQTQQNQQDVIEKVTKFKATKWIIFAIVLILALVVRDIGPGFGVVTREAFLMAICGALPTIMIAKDRDEKDSLKIFKEFMTYFGVFFAGHYALQMGGFYTHLFMKV